MSPSDGAYANPREVAPHLIRMIGIVIEGILFVALLAAAGALVLYVVLHYTPLGTWLRQIRNRRRIERALEQTCPIHGAFRTDELVRLSSGERVCPECFKETAWQIR